MWSKGQTFSADFLIAACVFLSVTAIIYSYWFHTFSKIEEKRIVEDMSDKLFLLARIWSKEGYPIHWSANDVKELGLQNEHKLNSTKIVSLKELGYQKVKDLTGCGLYDFFFRVYNQTNHTIFQFGIFPQNANYVLKTRRLGILNESMVMIDVILWK